MDIKVVRIFRNALEKNKKEGDGERDIKLFYHYKGGTGAGEREVLRHHGPVTVQAYRSGDAVRNRSDILNSQAVRSIV